jgi:hypothetical protein
MANFNWAVLIALLHLPVVIAALAMLAVPTWRRWLLSQTWLPAFFLVAGYGVFYIAMLWPEALGGWSVGLPLVLALIGGVLIWLVISFINEWRTDRASAVETLALMVIITAGAVAAEHFIGKDWWWLALGPIIAWFGVRWLVMRARARGGDAS